jgi:hypothetical protein
MTRAGTKQPAPPSPQNKTTKQVAADANSAAQTYPDQSLYPADSVPKVVERINNVRGGPWLLGLGPGIGVWGSGSGVK